MNVADVIVARWELADTAAHYGWRVVQPLPGHNPAWVSCILYRDGVRISVEWADDLHPTGCEVTIADNAYPTITIPACPQRSAQGYVADYKGWRVGHTTLARLEQDLIDLDVIDLRELT